MLLDAEPAAERHEFAVAKRALDEASESAPKRVQRAEERAEDRAEEHEEREKRAKERAKRRAKERAKERAESHAQWHADALPSNMERRGEALGLPVFCAAGQADAFDAPDAQQRIDGLAAVIKLLAEHLEVRFPRLTRRVALFYDASATVVHNASQDAHRVGAADSLRGWIAFNAFWHPDRLSTSYWYLAFCHALAHDAHAHDGRFLQELERILQENRDALA